MKNAVLRINHLTCGYEGKTILNDISFSASSSEIISVIGPNGSGKTTLIRAITNILKPREGEILIEGKNIRKISGKQLSIRTAVVMQSVETPTMTVEEYILLGRLPFFRKYQFFETKSDIALAHRYMELTDTFRLKDKQMGQLSGGERQLASIARALVQEPVLLLLDEPTSHLDITHQVQILELISRMNQELNLTVLMVVHDLNLAAEYSDRLILINGKNGKIHSVGTPKEVLTEKSIQEVYNTRVLIKKNPVSEKPCVFLVTESAQKRKA